MKSTVSERGQVVIPKALRDKMGIVPGTKLDFKLEKGWLVVVKVIDENPLDKWQGIAKLPFGKNTDEYIRIIRDGDGG